MITLKRFEYAFEQLDYMFLANYYLENKEFLVEMFDLIRLTYPNNVYLINKFKDYLNEEDL